MCILAWHRKPNMTLSIREMCPNTKKLAEAHFKMSLDTSRLTGYIFKCAWINLEIFRNQRRIFKCVTIPMMLTNPLKSNFSRSSWNSKSSNARASISFSLKSLQKIYLRTCCLSYVRIEWRTHAWGKDDRLEEGEGGGGWSWARTSVAR